MNPKVIIITTFKYKHAWFQFRNLLNFKNFGENVKAMAECKVLTFQLTWDLTAV